MDITFGGYSFGHDALEQAALLARKQRRLGGAKDGTGVRGSARDGVSGSARGGVSGIAKGGTGNANARGG